jgi:alkanesulfonate monooxygenase SsuD/methylene tetrahydromethanopterin reductase-like flavin-dependent oxidoreductase (luciferase family)
MRFGILYEIEARRGASPQEVGELFWQCLEQVKAAEEAGFDYVWAVEHHFLYPYSCSSAPEVFLAAVAQHTQRIRIGHGVVLLPRPYNHPVRVAERAAVLDILSRGRLELGTGRSATLLEIEGFGLRPEETRPMWEEAVRMIPRMWLEESFRWQGEYYQIPPRNVTPKPLQQPHPPLWMAGTQPSSGQLAGKYGLGLLHFTFSGPEALRESLEHYREAVARAEPVGAFVNEQVAALTLAFCGRDDREAIELGGRGPLYRVLGAKRVYSELAAAGDDTYKWYRMEAERIPEKERADIEQMVEDAIVCVGGPETCRQVIQRYCEQGIDQMIVMMQFALTPHELVLDSIRRFGEKVIPYFR